MLIPTALEKNSIPGEWSIFDYSDRLLVVQILRLVPAFRRSDSRSQRRAEVAVVQASEGKSR